MEDGQEKKEKNLKPKKADKAIKIKSFSRLFIRKLLIRTKSDKTKNAENVGRISIGRSFSRIRTLSPRKRLKMAKSLKEMTRRRKPMRRDECGEILMKFETVKSERKFGVGEELCKKRILMGGKCKPLMGGMLQYDRDGVLKSDIRS